MLFNSFSFVLLVLITFVLYYLPYFKKLQVPILIISSFIFYAYNQPVLLALLISSIIINATTSFWVHNSTGTKRRFYAVAGVVLNLSGIAFFKYSPLFGRTFFDPGNSIGEFLIMIPLPIGISFYTFEGITLLVDTFKGEVVEKGHELISKNYFKHVSNTTLFIAFFPHLVAGPILKAHEFYPQIETKYFKNIDWERSFKFLVLGYFLKMVIADNLKEYTTWISFPYFQEQNTLTLIVLLFDYSMQIFADFAGYSLIALGVALLFGYELQNNFNFPYISRSFSEFWKRWHISLSSFLQHYLYIPLGGNRKGKIRTYLNLLIVMFLGGLWHGASWSYAVWGTFHGLALAVERFLGERIKLPKTQMIRYLQMFVVFIFVTFAWTLFKLTEFKDVVLYVQSIFTNIDAPFGSVGYSVLAYSGFYCLPVILYHLQYLWRQQNVPSPLISGKYQYIPLAFMLFLIVTNSGSANDFIYFQF